MLRGIGDDDPRGAFSPRCLNRNVGDQGTVAEIAPVQPFRFEDQRNRHAGPDRAGKIAHPQHHLIASQQIGRDRPKRDGE